MNYWVEKGLGAAVIILTVILAILAVIVLPALGLSYVFGLELTKAIVMWVLLVALFGMKNINN